MSRHQVILASVSNVVPASSTPQPCWKRLSNLDFMLAGNHYSKFVHYYKPLPFTFDSFVAKLKESLALVLVDFFVIAGRVVPGDDGRPQVKCNDAGVPLRIAHTNARYDDWNSLEECTIEDELNTPVEFFPDLANAPIFQLQVTRFACGGIAIGCGVCEVVVDGYSSAEFLHAWSRVHRGLSITPPLFDSDLFKARDPPIVKVPVRDYVAGTPLLPEGSAYKVVDAASAFRRKFITLSGSNIQALVAEIESGPFSYGRTTSFEAVAGLIWKAITEARNLPDDDITVYSYPLSWRGNKKWKNPPIPTNYFGNAIHVSSLPAKSGDIKSRHVSYAARLIHQDIVGMNTERLLSAIDWMEIQYRRGCEVGFNINYYNGKNVNCTSMYIFPIYETDFGWGKPLHYSLVPDAIFGDGIAFILPTAEGGRSRKVSISMPKPELEKLMKNNLIVKYSSSDESEDYRTEDNELTASLESLNLMINVLSKL